MGITGLLPLLKSISRQVHIGAYAGRAVAIDAYSWLHKGIYGSALDLYLKKPNRRYIEYCVSRAKLLESFQIKPILVFDGGQLPMKKEKENERSKGREKARQVVEKALRMGDKCTAWQYANKCVDVTTEHAHELIQVLKTEGIAYIVAPYEADAQMAYLNKMGVVDAVITEDSDLILFGCEKILFKMQTDGWVDEICIRDLSQATDCDLTGFTLDQLRQMCILSGCDYLSSFPKMGLKTAHKYISTYGDFELAFKAIKASGQFNIPSDYVTRFKMAELTFKHQRVYDDVTKCLTFLTPLPESLLSQSDIDWNFLGPDVPSYLAESVALGEICPNGYERFTEIRCREALTQSVMVDPVVEVTLPSRDNSLEIWRRLTLQRTRKSKIILGDGAIRMPLDMMENNVQENFCGRSSSVSSSKTIHTKASTSTPYSPYFSQPKFQLHSDDSARISMMASVPFPAAASTGNIEWAMGGRGLMLNPLHEREKDGLGDVAAAHPSVDDEYTEPSELIGLYAFNEKNAKVRAKMITRTSTIPNQASMTSTKLWSMSMKSSLPRFSPSASVSLRQFSTINRSKKSLRKPSAGASCGILKYFQSFKYPPVA